MLFWTDHIAEQMVRAFQADIWIWMNGFSAHNIERSSRSGSFRFDGRHGILVGEVFIVPVVNIVSRISREWLAQACITIHLHFVRDTPFTHEH